MGMSVNGAVQRFSGYRQVDMIVTICYITMIARKEKLEMVVIKASFPRVRCQHCGYEWQPRKTKIRWCPKCHYPEIEQVKVGSRKEERV